MSGLTRFIASPNITAAINPNRADPGAWSAPAAAEGQAAEQFGHTAERVFAQLGNAMNQEEKVDALYVAQSKAELQVQYNNQLKLLNSKAVAGGAYQNDAVGAFDQLAMGYVKGAPNKKTQEHMLPGFASMRGSAYLHADKVQNALNYTKDMNDLGEGTDSLMQLGLQNPTPENVKNIRDQVDGWYDAAAKKGYDPNELLKSRNKVFDKFDGHLAVNTAQTNPALAIDKINSGSYNHLGPAMVAQIKTKAEAQFKSQVSFLDKQRADLEDRIIRGMKLPDNTPEILGKAAAMEKHNPGTIKPFKELMHLESFSNTVSKLPIDKQIEEQLALDIYTNKDAEFSPKLRDNMHKVLKQNLDYIEKDGLGFYAKQGVVSISPLPPAPGPKSTPVEQAAYAAALQDRQYAAEVAGQLSGRPVLPVIASELKSKAAELESLPANKKVAALQQFASIDSSIAPQIAKHLSDKNKDGPTATALQVLPLRPQIADLIFKGEEMLQPGGTAKHGSPDDYKSSIDTIAELFPGDQKTQKQILAAADAYRAGKGDVVITDSHVQEVLGTVKAGGFFSGYQTIPPRPDMNAAEFNKLTEVLSQKDLMKYGNGAPVYSPGQPFDPSTDSLSNYQFKPVDIHSGRYYVQRGDKALKNEQGGLYIIDLRKALS